MTRFVGWMMLAACASAPVATPSQRAVVEVLAARHHVDCARVAAVTSDPVGDLVWVAESWSDPGWIAVRAAECLPVVADPASYEVVATRWAGDPDRLGLAEVVADSLDAVDPAVAARLDRALAAGPHAMERTP